MALDTHRGGVAMNLGLPDAVVVGVDGSNGVLHATRWAAARAARDDVRVRLVHAHRPVPGAAERGAHWLQEARDAALRVWPDAEFEVVLRAGDPVDVLVTQSGSAGVLVLGTRMVHGHGGLLSGSSSVRIACAAACPVVVARGRRNGEPPPRTGPVVVGVDDSAHAEAALAFAVQEAADERADLIAVHAWLAGQSSPDRSSLDQADALLDTRLKQWRDKYPGVHMVVRAVRDQALRALLHFAANARLLVVGNRGPDTTRSLVLGSTAQHLLHHAAGPIAVVRADVSL